MAHMKMLCALRDRLPVSCLMCGERTSGGVCRHCRTAVWASMAAQHPRCLRCGLTLVSLSSACMECRDLSAELERVVTAFDYAWPGDLLIQHLKQRRRFSCAPALAALLAERCDELRRLLPFPDALWCKHRTLVTAVPASRQSLIGRGYNPAGEIGRDLARRLALEWRPDLLQRVREGPRQKGGNRQARRRSVQGLYRCCGDVAGRQVLIWQWNLRRKAF